MLVQEIVKEMLLEEIKSLISQKFSDNVKIILNEIDDNFCLITFHVALFSIKMETNYGQGCIGYISAGDCLLFVTEDEINNGDSFIFDRENQAQIQIISCLDNICSWLIDQQKQIKLAFAETTVAKNKYTHNGIDYYAVKTICNTIRQTSADVVEKPETVFYAQAAYVVSLVFRRLGFSSQIVSGYLIDEENEEYQHFWNRVDNFFIDIYADRLDYEDPTLVVLMLDEPNGYSPCEYFCVHGGNQLENGNNDFSRKHGFSEKVLAQVADKICTLPNISRLVSQN